MKSTSCNLCLFAKASSLTFSKLEPPACSEDGEERLPAGAITGSTRKSEHCAMGNFWGCLQHKYAFNLTSTSGLSTFLNVALRVQQKICGKRKVKCSLNSLPKEPSSFANHYEAKTKCRDKQDDLFCEEAPVQKAFLCGWHGPQCMILSQRLKRIQGVFASFLVFTQVTTQFCKILR